MKKIILFVALLSAIMTVTGCKTTAEVKGEQTVSETTIVEEKSKAISPKILTDVGNYCGTWACSQYLTEESNMPTMPLSYSTIRQTVRTSIAGKAIRIKFSNICGDNDLELKSVHIARTAEPGVAFGKIDTSTDTIVTFGGKESAVIPKGEELYSDTFEFNFDALTQLSISIYYGAVPSKVTGHPGSRTTSCIELGNFVSEEKLSIIGGVEHWYTIAAIDVAETDAGSTDSSIICFGDSITDGRGSTTDKQNRWTDNFATRLQNCEETKNLAVINQGIGGTLVSGSGVYRFNQDVLSQNGAKQILMLYGINDIIYANMSASAVIEVYKGLIKKAHENNMKFIGGTILPFGKCGDFTQKREEVRQAVNKWIRETSAEEGGFDGYVDFDKAMLDPDNPVDMKKEYNCGDGLHPSAKGYVQMAEAIDLELFK